MSRRGPEKVGSGRAVLAVGVVLGIVGAIAALVPRAPLRAGPRAVARDDAADDVVALVQKQLERSLRLIELIERSLAIGSAVPATSLETYIWSRHVLEARLFLNPGDDAPRTQDVELYLVQARGPARPEQVAAFEEHARRMQALEGRLRPLAEGRKISPFDFAKVEYARLEAEVWLAREKGRR